MLFSSWSDVKATMYTVQYTRLQYVLLVGPEEEQQYNRTTACVWRNNLKSKAHTPQTRVCDVRATCHERRPQIPRPVRNVTFFLEEHRAQSAEPSWLAMRYF
jgi:hypothetical protein